MNGGKVVAALAAIVLAQQAVPAWAQTPAAPAAPQPASEPVDEARLALARQIIAAILPPDQRDAIMRRMQQAMMASFSANFHLPPQLNDPGLAKIIRDYLDGMPAMMEPVMAQHMPAYLETLAHAYARNFTREELEQVLNFAHTPAGAKYFSRSTTLMQDPEVASEMGTMMRATQQAAMSSAADLQAKIRAYLTAHPEVAKRLAQGAKKPS